MLNPDFGHDDEGSSNPFVNPDNATALAIGRQQVSSSAVDARTVIAVEKTLTAGGVIHSEKVLDAFSVAISLPDQRGTFRGYGRTFSEAFNDAYRQLPQPVAA